MPAPEEATTDLVSQVERLQCTAGRYWAGEAEVVRTYFSRPRTKEQEIQWLTLQCYKEMTGSGFPGRGGLVQGPIEELRRMFPLIDIEVDRHEFLHVAEGLYEEFKHYTLMADLHDWLTGERIVPSRIEPLPEDRRLAELRLARRALGPVEMAAVHFTEGGGSALFYAGKRISGGEFERRVAAACQTVWDDEVDHVAYRFREVAEAARTPEDWETVHRIVVEISWQRVVMRNEQFSFPLPPQRMAEIERGEIEPFLLPLAPWPELLKGLL